jgi:hypothetical protein
MDPGRPSHDGGCAIERVSIARGRGQAVGIEEDELLVISLHCVGAQIGAKLYLDGKPVPTVVAGGHLVIAYAHPAECRSDISHTVELVG